MPSKTVFVTGTTGHYGAAFAVAATQRHPASRFVTLVRADDEAHARVRLAAKWERLVGRDTALRLLDRWHVVPGELSQLPTLGDGVLDDATHVVHFAANTSFVEKKTVWRTNLEGTLALATRLRRARRLERFVYTGTAMICGRRAPGVVHEDESPNERADHVAQYTASKAATEQALVAQFPGLPLVVVRPSILAGDTRTGCSSTSSIFWAIRASHEIGLVPRALDCGIDIAPFDWAADAMVHLAFKPGLKHRRYHVSAGPARRSRFMDVGRAFAVLDGSDVDARYRPLPRLDTALLKQRFFETYARTPMSIAMYRGLKRYFDFSVLDLAFDSGRLRDEGFTRPAPRLDEYLPACLAQPGGLSTLEMFEDDVDQFDRVACAPDPVVARREAGLAAETLAA